MRKPGEGHRKALPLHALHILLALGDGARHGYAIKQHVEARTGGTVRLGPGTLYETIQRLEDSGLIGEADALPAANAREAQRRYYALTPLGWKTLEVEVRQLARLVDAARANPRLRKGLA